MNQFKKVIVFVILAALSSSCVKLYKPTIESIDSANYVVSGRLTSIEGYQYVTISKTSPIIDPGYIPVEKCEIDIIDDKSNSFHLEEFESGKYRVWMNQSELTIGTAYMLDITTALGEKLISDFDTMYSCGEIDSVYYERKDIPSSNSIPFSYIKGIRFYIDMAGDETNSKFYRWELIETWEYKVAQPIIWYYDGVSHHEVPPDATRMTCWQTNEIGNIYIISTENLSANSYKMYPLSFVNNSTQRLKHLYSLLINQHSLSEEAYTYFNDLRLNTNQDGGLYTKQPIDIKGNLYNQSSPEQAVLGFFSSSEIKQKRIFIKDVPNLTIEDPPCDTIMLRWGVRELSSRDYPAYMTGSDTRIGSGLLGKPCVDCLQMGGTIVKPDFWPN